MRCAPRLAFALVLALAASSACLQPTNAFDPDAPAELQAPGSLRGTVQAVLAPFNEATGAACEGDAVVVGAACDGDNAACCVPAAAFCAASDGDHSGFRLGLRGLVAADANDAVLAFSNETGPTGEFVFQNVPPGSYSLEIVRDGFVVPSTRTVDIAAGDDVALAPLCAIDATPPPPPALAGVPAVAPADGATVGFVVDVVGCAGDVDVDADADAVAAVDVVVRVGDREIAAARVTAVDADDAGACHVTVAADAPAASEVWVVEAVAHDAVGNASEPALASVIVDVDAPAAPVLGVPSVGLDRVSVSWSQEDGATDIARYLVSYGLVPRPDAQLCPSATHVIDPVFGDAFDVAVFAVEGPSPIVTAGLRQTLSGIAAGTELFVSVAAVDVAGNVSCYAPSLALRPDQVTPRLRPGVGAAAAARTVAGEGAVVAFAGGRLAVRDRAGAVVDVEVGGDVVDAFDVVAVDGGFVAAAGAVGVVVVDVDSAGAVVDVDVRGGHDVRTVAVVPGGLLFGTASGVALVTNGGAGEDVIVVDPGARGVPTTQLATSGELVIAARTSGQGNAATGVALQALQRVGAGGFNLVGETAVLSGAPRRLAIHSGRLWSIAGDFVEVYDVGGCTQLSATCLARVARFGLPNGADATDLVVVDAHVVVWSAAGGFVFPGAFSGVPPLVGRAFAPAGSALDVVRVDGAGFCASGVVDDTGARGERCFSLVSDGVPSERAGLTGRGAAVAVVAGDADELLWLDAQADGASDAGGARTVLQMTNGPSVIERAAPAVVDEFAGRATLKDVAAFAGFGAVAVDQYGRALIGAAGVVGELDVVDGVDAALAGAAPGLVGDGAVVVDDARVRVVGSDLVIAAVARRADDLVAGCPQAYVVRARLAPTGARPFVRVVDVDAVAVGRAFRITDAVVRGREVYVGLHPFGVAVVDVDDALAVDGSGVDACAAADADTRALNALALLGDRVLATGVKGAGFPAKDALFDVTTAPHQLLTSADSELRAVVSVGDFLAVTTQDPASAVLVRAPTAGDSTFFPLAAFAGVDAATALIATRSGVVVADGAAGIARFVIR